MAKTVRQPTTQQLIINKFVTVEFSAGKGFWGREIKVANSLLKKYPKDFLLWLEPPHGYKVTSLLHFLTEEGENYILSQLIAYKRATTDLSPKVSPVILSETKIGDDAIPVKKKPESLKDFLGLFNN